MAMNPEVKARWVAALRSGEYKQGTAALNNSNNEFCCLGVLCDVAVKSGVGEWSMGEGGSHLLFVDGGKDVSFLPRAVAMWAGLEPHGFGPRLTINGNSEQAAMHNDAWRHTFAEIADAIEAQL